ncbi:hypothetical protein BDV25DRAFT_149273 [Aspergillus avenaceus]|uniref:Zn(2)-C6 fungal-type domain-containing protein n=1 Tax=Aspergillus avenaceus TaxID=36643 RepID=A0A5N6U4S2_ASPAV|nr:hypothetical protein BDV25DRAFT_149273 [Aspergillus avenaceus]
MAFPQEQQLPLQTPCINCRSRHIKCTYESDECQSCQRHGWTCVRRNATRGPVQFRPGSRAKYDQAFASDQIWVKLGRKSTRLRFIDETTDVIAGYGSEAYLSDVENEGHEDEWYVPSGAAEQARSEVGRVPHLGPVYSTPDGILCESQKSATRASNMANVNVTNKTAITRDSDVQTAIDPSEKRNIGRPVTLVDDSDSRLQAILLRFFADIIGPRFDLCDNERHFSRIVPQRARSSPTLLNAILTTSARHLTRLRKYRNSSGMIEWQGHLLSSLSEETAVYYHNECIKDLLRLSMDPEQLHNEALLAAAIILRTDEEMDAPLREGEEDTEVFLGMLNMLINAQVPPVATLPHTSPAVYASHDDLYRQGTHAVHTSSESPSPSQSLSSPAVAIDVLSPHGNTYVARPDGLRQAAFWVALRQELFTSFMKQRPLNFPMAHCDEFRNLSPAEDVVWADRLVIFCADLLEFCYGNSNSYNPDRAPYPPHDPSRWSELQDYERELSLALPRTFQPIYYREAQPGSGVVFPEIWHLECCHVTGTMHLELARILLVAFDQSRPKLGPGSVARQRELSTRLKTIVCRLCGIALCNRQSPPAFIEALMGITMCGEYYGNRREQDALLGFLETMSEEHAFPTGKVEKMLMEAWGWT